MSDIPSSSDGQFAFDMGEVSRSGGFSPNRDEIREDLTGMLADARAVSPEAPWDERTLRYNRALFPNLAAWLPDDERDQYCFAFARELARIELLLAA